MIIRLVHTRWPCGNKLQFIASYSVSEKTEKSRLIVSIEHSVGSMFTISDRKYSKY